MKLLIFIVSYNAERHIASVLADIPAPYKNHPDTQILIIDDASRDNTVGAAKAYAAANGLKNIRVLKNARNQGYGGNQKVGYRYAIQNGFDVVVMLHGDNQYTPKALPELVEPFEKNPEVGCVLGVRFGERYSPLRGGMPFYKYIGNRILTTLQNGLAGVDLREWHTGYRAYSTRALSKIGFTLNTNDFHFDTEIILQLLSAKAEIVQVNIPTRYGDEICHVNGVRYAKDVVKSTLKYFLQRYHFFYDVRFHPEVLSQFHLSSAQEEEPYEDKLSFSTPGFLDCFNDRVIPEGARVLNIGREQGAIAAYLRNRSGCRVTTVDVSSLEDIKALHDLLDRNQYDVIIMLDVVERLATPELFLLSLSQRKYAKPPLFIFSVANVGFFAVRLMLFFGHFNYGTTGILNVTHKRIFSLHTFRNLLVQTGFLVGKEHFIGFPFASFNWPRWLIRCADGFNSMLIKMRPRLFSYHVILETTALGTADAVLEQTLEQEKVRA